MPEPRRTLLIVPALWAIVSFSAHAELSMPSIFGDSMVVQRDRPIHLWGWADAGATVSADIGDQSATATAGDDGRFDLDLPARSVGDPFEITVTAGDQTLTFADVLAGEVWICSGQSNMGWIVANTDDGDLETLAADDPMLRLISVPQVGTQELQRDFDGQWQHADRAVAREFSAVGYFFGKRLREVLQVPVGLIDNAWGGSAAEAWVPREVLKENGLGALVDDFERRMETYDREAELAKWQREVEHWREKGKKGPKPRWPADQRTGNHRPANIYNGVLAPTVGYPVAGVIWYQGESNSWRAAQYRKLFPLMIDTWRDLWNTAAEGTGDFPFYYVQLADFQPAKNQPGPSHWAELREAQTMTMDAVENTGMAVIINAGEAKDIHPRDKQTVADRLARWALAKNYGYDIAHRSPQYDSVQFNDGRATVEFKHVGGGLETFDTKKVEGFAIASEGGDFVWAKAKIKDKDTIEVWSDKVKDPAAVRYAWADNPVCNVESQEGLPLTPFRTDDRPMMTEGR